MKTLSAALEAAYGAPVQRPAFLVEIGFTLAGAGDFDALRLADLKFNGNTNNDAPGGIVFGTTGAAATDGPPKLGSASLDVNGTSPGGGGATQGVLGFGASSTNGWGLTEGDFTIEAWVYFNTPIETAYAPILRTFDDIGRTEVSFRVMPDDGSVYKLGAQVATSEAGFTIVGAGVGQPVIPIGSWFHAALSRKSGVYRVFQNGIQVATHTSTFASPATAKGVTIGTVGGFAIDGYIDELIVTKAGKYEANFDPEAIADNTVRWSSHGTVEWAGETWERHDVLLEGLQVDALQVRGALRVGNADGEIGSLILDYGIQDVPIRIWGYDAAAIAAADPVLLCEAVGAATEVGLMEARINLRHRSEFQLCPRTYINESNGFRTLQPSGMVLRINGQDIKLDRRGS